MFTENRLLQTDSYKVGHWPMYPDGTDYVYSYFESRLGAKWDYTVKFGLQYILLQDLAGVFATPEWIEEADIFFEAHFGTRDVFNRAGWEHIVAEHGGRLPIRIKSVPEGTKVPVSNVMMTVENTCPECYWVTNYVESVLTHVWYPSTVATLSRSVKEVIAHAIEQDGGDPGGLNFMLQDFGYRGAAMNEASRAGGAAHLVNFQGTDTLGGMALALDYYEAIPASLGFSVPASEHSVMTSLGREGEYEMLDRLLDKFPTGILSVVADSYDIYAFTEAVIARKDRIMARDGVFVLRPDSTTDQHRTPHGLTAHLAQMLWDGFGGTETEKGYRLLDEHVRLLWGDGIDAQGIASILNKLHLHNFAAGNIGCFGMGGGLLQKVNRDTQRFAFKCSAQHRDGVWHDVRKDPLDASKLSKAGRLKLVNDPAVGLITVREDDVQYAGQPDVLQVVFENGEVFTEGNSFDEIRERADA